jgi:phage head maturation protease
MALTERSVEALALAKDGYVTGFSVGFHPVRSSESKQDGRRQITRLEAKLDHVALLTSPNEPAYGDAQLVMAREFNADDKEQAPKLAKWRHLMSSQD